jgi:hypothetical protein
MRPYVSIAQSVTSWPVRGRRSTASRPCSVSAALNSPNCSACGARRSNSGEARGVPGERQEKLATLDAIVDLLTAKLKPDRIPGVVRRPSAAYGNRSILEAIVASDEALVLDELRSAFDWAAAA